MIGFLTGRTHNRLRSLLSSYIDGRVSESEAAWIEKHLTDCEECGAEVETLRTTVGLLRSLPEIEVTRTFTLDAAPVPVRFASPFVRATGIATSIAGVLLAVLLFGDVLGLVTQSDFTLSDNPFAAEYGAASRAAPAAPAAPAAAPATPAPAAPAAAAPAPTPAPAAPALAPAPAMAPAAAPAPAEEAQSGADAELQAVPAPFPERDPLTPEPVEQAARTAEVQASQAELAARSPVELPGTSDEQAPEVSERPMRPAIPLWQLESFVGGIFILLALATLWMLRRRQRSPF